MKKIIFNSTGNVGKSTIAREIIKANNSEYKLFEIETKNESSKKYESVEIGNIQEQKDILIYLIKEKNICVDIGSSDIFDFLDMIIENNLLDIIDTWIVPTSTTTKEFNDSKKTIALLTKAGVNTQKIQLLLNKVDYAHYKNEAYYEQYDKYALEANIQFNYKSSIYDSAVFTYLSEKKLTLNDFLQDNIDYIELIEHENDMNKLREYIKMNEFKSAAKNLQLHLQDISKLI